MGPHLYSKGTGGADWGSKRGEVYADAYDYLVIDDWPLKELEHKDSYKGFMNTTDECTLRSYHASYLVERKARPCIFLFNPPSFDSPNAIDWDFVRENCVIVHLEDKLY